jgi:small subunit ribosomal protein S15
VLSKVCVLLYTMLLFFDMGGKWCSSICFGTLTLFTLSPTTVIALTTRIQQLQTHLKTHRKDQHCKRGMTALYVRRRKLLDYMERKDFESFRRVVKTLGLAR